MLAPPAGGSGQPTGRGPDAVVGQAIPANSVLFRGASPAPRSGALTPDRSVELRRAVCRSRYLPYTKGGSVMRHIGVDLHKTNFVRGRQI